MDDKTLKLDSLLDGHDDLPAMFLDEQVWSRSELRAASKSAAAGLRALGLKRGDSLALWLPNVPAWLQLLFAAADLGVLIVPVSTRYKQPEVRHVLTVSGARFLVCADSFLDTDYAAIARQLSDEVPTVERVITVSNLYDWLGFDPSEPAREVSGDGQGSDLLCCFSTSGTTGFPKLAAHDHRSIARHAILAGKAMDFRPGDKVLASLPLYGVFGFMAALTAIAHGAACDLVLVYKAEEAAASIDARSITHVIGSDSMFDPILKVPGCRFESWRRLVQADFVGLSLSVVQQAARFGIVSTGTYGSSELFALCSFWPADATDEERARAGGKPVDPAMKFRITDPETGEPAQSGTPGELQYKGPNVLAGYLNNPEASAAAFTADGWFRTGDLATEDGEAFVYLSRMNDTLRLRGYLVNPAEIENVLMQHPAVSGAQVVGVMQQGKGDAAVAFVTLRDHRIDEAGLREHCKSQMAAFKLPARIQSVAEFPSVNGPNGVKIQKRVLRQMAADLIEHP